jgi:hypothetical protein
MLRKWRRELSLKGVRVKVSRRMARAMTPRATRLRLN